MLLIALSHIPPSLEMMASSTQCVTSRSMVGMLEVASELEYTVGKDCQFCLYTRKIQRCIKFSITIFQLSSKAWNIFGIELETDTKLMNQARKESGKGSELAMESLSVKITVPSQLLNK